LVASREMTLDELLTCCAASTPADWNTITAWGARSGPSYLDRFMPVEKGRPDGDTVYELQHEQHGMRASYEPDLAISIAWGLDLSPSLSPVDGPRTFNEDWATGFPDPEATAHFLDFFYYGTLVEREVYVNVDARCNLPLPRKEFDGEGSDAKLKALTITPWQQSFFRTLNALETTVDYDSYLRRAGFEVRS
jgi:hypothetical protein